jgi:uncharacterized membrane protein YdcZ (DUF606 family)
MSRQVKKSQKLKSSPRAVYLVALAAGMFSAMQSAVNTRLAQHVGGPIMSAVISVIITGIALVPVVLVARAPWASATTLCVFPGGHGQEASSVHCY